MILLFYSSITSLSLSISNFLTSCFSHASILFSSCFIYFSSITFVFNTLISSDFVVNNLFYLPISAICLSSIISSVFLFTQCKSFILLAISFSQCLIDSIAFSWSINPYLNVPFVYSAHNVRVIHLPDVSRFFLRRFFSISWSLFDLFFELHLILRPFQDKTLVCFSKVPSEVPLLSEMLL